MLIRVALILLLIYILVKLFTRYVFPYIIKRFIRKTQEKYQRERDSYYEERSGKKKEGEIHVNYVPDDYNQKNKDDLGEYIDYEELDDDKHKKDKNDE